MHLLPRDEKFYALFLKQVEIISKAARVLFEGLRIGNSRLAGAATEISVLENRGDEVIHSIFKLLNQTFITPIDPEDIHNLSSALDNVLDGIEDTAHCLVSYEINPIPHEMLELAGTVNDCAMAAKKAFEALAANGHIMAHCIEINRLENEADTVSRRAIGRLFEQEQDPITLIKLKELYEVLETATDKAEDAANVLESVVLKSA